MLFELVEEHLICGVEAGGCLNSASLHHQIYPQVLIVMDSSVPSILRSKCLEVRRPKPSMMKSTN